VHPGENANFYRDIETLNGDGNIFYAAKNPSGARRWLEERRKVGWDANSRTDDPMFEDLENFNFRLKEGSPALEQGFRQIPFERIGLLEKPAVRRLRESGLSFSELLAGKRVRN
jgi:hypothetical protein